MESGRLPSDGLCGSLSGTVYKETLENVFENLYIEGTYWGADIIRNDNDLSEHYNFRRLHEYGSTRQSIVLLICAMHNEL